MLNLRCTRTRIGIIALLIVASAAAIAGPHRTIKVGARSFLEAYLDQFDAHHWKFPSQIPIPRLLVFDPSGKLVVQNIAPGDAWRAGLEFPPTHASPIAKGVRQLDVMEKVIRQSAGKEAFVPQRSGRQWTIVVLSADVSTCHSCGDYEQAGEKLWQQHRDQAALITVIQTLK